MMKTMRSGHFIKWTLWIVVIAFVLTIFAVWGLDITGGGAGGGPQASIVGSVDGVPITDRQYQDAIRLVTNQMRQQAGNRALNSWEIKQAENSAWENLIAERIQSKLIDELDIKVSDDELVNYLRANPPPQVQEYFTDSEGRFDYQAYLAAFNDPTTDWRAVEAWAMYVIPQLKLSNYVQSSVHVSEREIRERWEEDNIRVRVELLRLPVAVQDDPSNQPSEAEILEYYNENGAEEFRLEAYSTVETVSWQIKPTKEDTIDAFERVKFLLQELDRGESFEDLARVYSQDPSAENGGDLGFFGRGAMVPDFENPVFALETGEVSEPILTQFGVHLVRVDEKRVTEDGDEEVHARHILLKIEPSYATIDTLEASAQSFVRTAKSDGWEAAVAKAGVVASPPVDVRAVGPISDLGYVPDINDWAMENQSGAISRVFSDDRGFYVVHLLERHEESVEPLEAVRGRIEVLLKRRKAFAQERKRVEAARQQILSGRSFPEVAAEIGASYEETAPYTRSESVPGIGSGNVVTLTPFYMEPGSVSDPLEYRDSIWLVRIVERSTFDEEQYRADRDALRLTILEEKANSYASRWYEEMRENLPIEDFRSRLSGT